MYVCVCVCVCACGKQMNFDRSTLNFIGIFIGVHREAFQTGFLLGKPPLNTDELSINE